jgi:hypothetical protein
VLGCEASPCLSPLQIHTWVVDASDQRWWCQVVGRVTRLFSVWMDDVTAQKSPRTVTDVQIVCVGLWTVHASEHEFMQGLGNAWGVDGAMEPWTA